MIVAKNSVKDFIRNQPSVEHFANRIKFNRMTVYNLLNGNGISPELIAKIIEVTGFTFENAFEIVTDKKGE